TTSAAVTVTVDNLAPTVSLDAPATGAAVAGASVTVAATASDNVAVAGVQFTLDGVNLGAEATSPPYSLVWNTTAAAPGLHTLAAIACAALVRSTTSAAVTVTVDNIFPTVSLDTPAAGAAVAGASVTVSATAS